MCLGHCCEAWSAKRVSVPVTLLISYLINQVSLPSQGCREFLSHGMLSGALSSPGTYETQLPQPLLFQHQLMSGLLAPSGLEELWEHGLSLLGLPCPSPGRYHHTEVIPHLVRCWGGKPAERGPRTCWGCSRMEDTSTVAVHQHLHGEMKAMKEQSSIVSSRQGSKVGMQHVCQLCAATLSAPVSFLAGLSQ